MAHDKAYLICENKCLVEGMPKEELVEKFDDVEEKKANRDDVYTKDKMDSHFISKMFNSTKDVFDYLYDKLPDYEIPCSGMYYSGSGDYYPIYSVSKGNNAITFHTFVLRLTSNNVTGEHSFIFNNITITSSTWDNPYGMPKYYVNCIV